MIADSLRVWHQGNDRLVITSASLLKGKLRGCWQKTNRCIEDTVVVTKGRLRDPDCDSKDSQVDVSPRTE